MQVKPKATPRIALLLSALLTPVALADGEPTARWDQVASALAEFSVHRSEIGLRISSMSTELSNIEQDGSPWQSPDDDDAIVSRVRFTDPDDRSRVVDYIIAPWARLSWRGPASEHPAFVTATPQVLIIGPVHSTADEPMENRSHALIQSVVHAEAAERGMSMGHSTHAVHDRTQKKGPIFLFRPAYVRINHPADAQATVNFIHELAWDGVAQSRLVVVDAVFNSENDSYRRIEIHPPAEVDRSRPALHDPLENRLAPDVDLAAATTTLNARLCGAYVAAVRSLLESDANDDDAVEAAIQAVRDDITDAVAAHPAYSGPALAASEPRIKRALAEVRTMLAAAALPAPKQGDWPDTLLSFRPGLILELAALPAADPNHLPELLTAFARQREAARNHPGRWNEHPPADIDRRRVYEPSDEELLLAEVGDRLRTVVGEISEEEVVAAVRQANLKPDDLAYDGFTFKVFGEDREFARFVDGQVHITLLDR